jgi:hypothetical protein
MSNNTICYIILLVVLLLFYYYLNSYECNNYNYKKYPEEFYNNYFDLKNDTSNSISNVENIVCSKDCCSTQWPISENIHVKDPKINMDEYLPTNLNCNNGINDTGCICKKKTI